MFLDLKGLAGKAREWGPSTSTVPCITKCFGLQLPVQRMRATKHRVQKKLRDLHPGLLQNHCISRLPHPCEVPACAASHQKGTVRALKLEMSGEKHLLPPLTPHMNETQRKSSKEIVFPYRAVWGEVTKAWTLSQAPTGMILSLKTRNKD